MQDLEKEGSRYAADYEDLVMIKGWNEKKIGKMLSLEYGKSLPKEKRETGGFPVYGSNGIVDTHIEPAITGPGIIVGRKGSCGSVHFSETDFWPIDTTYYVKLKQKDNLRFTAYMLSSLGLSKMNSHSTIPGLNRDSVYNLSVPLPPLPEQKKIAAILLKIQQAITAQEKIIESLQDLKKSTMQHLFTKGLRGEKTKMTENGEIPKSWEITNLAAIATIGAGGTPSRGNSKFWHEGTIPWVKTGEVNYCVITETEECITPLGLKNSAAKILPKGTLLLAMYGQGITRGKVAILGIEASTNQACASIQPDASKVKLQFLYHYLSWSYDRLRTLSHGAQQANLNAKIVAGLKVTLPTIIEQDEIANQLNTLDNKLNIHKSKKYKQMSLFKTTLNKLMSGEIRVANLDIDVKEVEA